MNTQAPDVYEWTGPTGVKFRQIRSPAGTYYHEETPIRVRAILDTAMNTGQRLRLFYGDTVTGMSWLEEFDVCGTIGRSMGEIKIPLLIANARAHGGPGILDRCIVAIADAPGHFVYKHPGFNTGEWTAGKAHDAGYVEAAYCNGELHAQFKKQGQASRYIAFMKGERFSK
jgi:hypothetical protein